MQNLLRQAFLAHKNAKIFLRQGGMQTPKIVYIGILIKLDLKKPEIKFYFFIFFLSYQMQTFLMHGDVQPPIIYLYI